MKLLPLFLLIAGCTNQMPIEPRLQSMITGVQHSTNVPITGNVISGTWFGGAVTLALVLLGLLAAWSLYLHRRSSKRSKRLQDRFCGVDHPIPR